MDKVTIDVQGGENSYDSQRHDIVWGIFNRKSPKSISIVGGAIKAEITEPRQQGDLLQSGLEVLCVLILEHH